MNSSIFSSSLRADYAARPRLERVGHVMMALAGAAVLFLWTQKGPELVPTCRTMAVGALSPETEVIVTGTSRIERGVDPRLFRSKVVNLSSGGLSYATMNPIIKRAIEKAPNTRLVIIEFDIFLLKGKGLIQERLFEMGLPLNEWPMPLSDKFWYLIHNGGPLSAMPRLDVEYYAQAVRPNERPPPGSDGYNPYTFLRDLTAPDADMTYGASKYIQMHLSQLVGDLDGMNIASLLELLGWLDDRGIRWVLVTLPHHPGWISGRPEAWTQSVAAALAAVQEHYRDTGINDWDASSSLGLGDLHFHDGVHLNRLGVEAFNRALDERINGWLTP